MSQEQAYWSILRECLLRFHHKSPAAAARLVGSYRKAIGGSPLVYHLDPFGLANDLAGERLDVDAHADAYQAIRDEHYRTQDRLIRAG